MSKKDDKTAVRLDDVSGLYRTATSPIAKASIEEQKQASEAKKADALLELLVRRQEERQQRESDLQKLIAQKAESEATIKKLARKKMKSKNQDKAIDGIFTDFVMGGFSGKTKNLRLKPGYKTGVSEILLTLGKKELLLAMRTEEVYGSPVFLVSDLQGRLEENIKKQFLKTLRNYMKGYVLFPQGILDMWIVRS